MQRLTKKTGSFIRTVSSLIIAAFSLQEVAFAAGPETLALGVTSASQQNRVVPAVPLEEVVQSPAKLDIPFDHVTLKEVHSGTNGRLIVHIQDPHANYSGQMSIAKALDRLMTSTGQYLVLAEGASQDATLSDAKSGISKKDWEIAARRFLQEGLIVGVEYLNLTSDHPMKIMGVEDKPLYDAALEAYGDLVEKRKKILVYLHAIHASMDRLKARLYSQALLEHERKVRGSDGGAADLTVQLDSLMALIGPAGVDLAAFPEVSRLAALKMMEKSIRFDRANLEQEKLLAELSAKGFKDRVQEFLKAAKKTRNQQVSQSSLIDRLFDLAASQGIDLNHFPELARYRESLKAFSGLDIEAAMHEMEFLEDTVYKNLLPGEEGRKLRAVDRFVGLLEKAYRIKMSSHDFKMLAANRPDFDTTAWQAFLNDELLKLEYFDDLVPFKPYFEEAAEPLFRFYKLVDERDMAFLKNTERIVNEENTAVSYLIAGGYHTEHLAQLLKNAGYSLAVLTPSVEFETDQSLYEKILLMPLKLAAKEKSGSERQLAKSEDQPTRSTLAQSLVRNLSKSAADARFNPHTESPTLAAAASRLATIARRLSHAANRGRTAQAKMRGRLSRVWQAMDEYWRQRQTLNPGQPESIAVEGPAAIYQGFRYMQDRSDSPNAMPFSWTVRYAGLDSVSDYVASEDVWMTKETFIRFVMSTDQVFERDIKSPGITGEEFREQLIRQLEEGYVPETRVATALVRLNEAVEDAWTGGRKLDQELRTAVRKLPGILDRLHQDNVTVTMPDPIVEDFMTMRRGYGHDAAFYHIGIWGTMDLNLQFPFVEPVLGRQDPGYFWLAIINPNDLRAAREDEKPGAKKRAFSRSVGAFYYLSLDGFLDSITQLLEVGSKQGSPEYAQRVVEFINILERDLEAKPGSEVGRLRKDILRINQLGGAAARLAESGPNDPISVRPLVRHIAGTASTLRRAALNATSGHLWGGGGTSDSDFLYSLIGGEKVIGQSDYLRGYEFKTQYAGDRISFMEFMDKVVFNSGMRAGTSEIDRTFAALFLSADASGGARQGVIDAGAVAKFYENPGAFIREAKEFRLTGPQVDENGPVESMLNALGGVVEYFKQNATTHNSSEEVTPAPPSNPTGSRLAQQRGRVIRVATPASPSSTNLARIGEILKSGPQTGDWDNFVDAFLMRVFGYDGASTTQGRGLKPQEMLYVLHRLHHLEDQRYASYDDEWWGLKTVDGRVQGLVGPNRAAPTRHLKGHPFGAELEQIRQRLPKDADVQGLARSVAKAVNGKYSDPQEFTQALATAILKYAFSPNADNQHLRPGSRYDERMRAHYFMNMDRMRVELKGGKYRLVLNDFNTILLDPNAPTEFVMNNGMWRPRQREAAGQERREQRLRARAKKEAANRAVPDPSPAQTLADALAVYDAINPDWSVNRQAGLTRMVNRLPKHTVFLGGVYLVDAENNDTGVERFASRFEAQHLVLPASGETRKFLIGSGTFGGSWSRGRYSRTSSLASVMRDPSQLTQFFQSLRGSTYLDLREMLLTETELAFLRRILDQKGPVAFLAAVPSAHTAAGHIDRSDGNRPLLLLVHRDAQGKWTSEALLDGKQAGSRLAGADHGMRIADREIRITVLSAKLVAMMASTRSEVESKILNSWISQLESINRSSNPKKTGRTTISFGAFVRIMAANARQPESALAPVLANLFSSEDQMNGFVADPTGAAASIRTRVVQQSSDRNESFLAGLNLLEEVAVEFRAPGAPVHFVPISGRGHTWTLDTSYFDSQAAKRLAEFKAGLAVREIRREFNEKTGETKATFEIRTATGDSIAAFDLVHRGQDADQWFAENSAEHLDGYKARLTVVFWAAHDYEPDYVSPHSSSDKYTADYQIVLVDALSSGSRLADEKHNAALSGLALPIDRARVSWLARPNSPATGPARSGLIEHWRAWRDYAAKKDLAQRAARTGQAGDGGQAAVEALVANALEARNNLLTLQYGHYMSIQQPAGRALFWNVPGRIFDHWLKGVYDGQIRQSLAEQNRLSQIAGTLDGIRQTMQAIDLPAGQLFNYLDIDTDREYDGSVGFPATASFRVHVDRAMRILNLLEWADEGTYVSLTRDAVQSVFGTPELSWADGMATQPLDPKSSLSDTLLKMDRALHELEQIRRNLANQYEYETSRIERGKIRMASSRADQARTIEDIQQEADLVAKNLAQNQTALERAQDAVTGEVGTRGSGITQVIFKLQLKAMLLRRRAARLHQELLRREAARTTKTPGTDTGSRLAVTREEIVAFQRILSEFSNSTKDKWIKYYDAIRAFVGRIEKNFPEAVLRRFAAVVHDNGYFAGELSKLQPDSENPLLGGLIPLTDQELAEFLTPEGWSIYKERYQNPGGFKIKLNVIRRELLAEFFARVGKTTLAGKNVEQLDALYAENPVIANANAMTWADMDRDADNYTDPSGRRSVMLGNQKTALISAALARDNQPRDVWAIWTVTGQWNGKYAYDGLDPEGEAHPDYRQDPVKHADKSPERLKVWQVSADYTTMDPKEIQKDVDVYKAVKALDVSILDMLMSGSRLAEADAPTMRIAQFMGVEFVARATPEEIERLAALLTSPEDSDQVGALARMIDGAWKHGGAGRAYAVTTAVGEGDQRGVLVGLPDAAGPNAEVGLLAGPGQSELVNILLSIVQRSASSDSSDATGAGTARIQRQLNDPTFAPLSTANQAGRIATELRAFLRTLVHLATRQFYAADREVVLVRNLGDWIPKLEDGVSAEDRQKALKSALLLIEKYRINPKNKFFFEDLEGMRSDPEFTDLIGQLRNDVDSADLVETPGRSINFRRSVSPTRKFDTEDTAAGHTVTFVQEGFVDPAHDLGIGVIVARLDVKALNKDALGRIFLSDIISRITGAKPDSQAFGDYLNLATDFSPAMYLQNRFQVNRFALPKVDSVVDFIREQAFALAQVVWAA